MAVPNKSEWSVAFDYIFAELSEKELPLSSFSFFKAINPLKFNSKGEALFQCPKCPRHWGSINRIINFDYRLSINSDTEIGYGDVKLWAFGQKCQKCTKCPFVPAKFTDDAIDHALRELLLKVREKFFNEDVTAELLLLKARRTSGKKFKSI